MAQVPTVLIVDDDTDSRIIYRTALQHRGFHVREASSVQEARRSLESDCPDVLLLDRKFPDGHDGLEIARLPLCDDAVVICISGLAMLEDQKEALVAGCDLYLPKPVGPTEVADTVVELLARRNRKKGRTPGI